MSRSSIIYPRPLQGGSKIAVAAISAGVPENLHSRLDDALDYLRSLGFEVVEGPNTRKLHKLQSTEAEERARVFMQFWKDDSVDLIMPPWGGNFVMQMLDYLDFQELMNHRPKWIMGFSDISTFTFPFTLATGIATAHGDSLMSMIADQSGELIHNWPQVLGTTFGEEVVQNSSAFHTRGSEDWEENFQDSWKLDLPTKWMTLGGDRTISLSGRLIGGCLDTLMGFPGTRYDLLAKFKERHTQEGTILFLENCEMSAAQASRALWSFMEAGWFDNLNGLIFGRCMGPDHGDYTWTDAVNDVFSDVSFPVILDADIGHSPPQMTLVNGSLATIEVSEGGKSRVVQKFI